MIGVSQDGFMGMDSGDSQGDGKVVVIGLPYTASVCRALAQHVTHVMPVPFLIKHIELDRSVLHAKGIMHINDSTPHVMLDSVDMIELSMLNDHKSFERYAKLTIRSEAEGKCVLLCASHATYGESILMRDIKEAQKDITDLKAVCSFLGTEVEDIISKVKDGHNDDSN